MATLQRIPLFTGTVASITDAHCRNALRGCSPEWEASIHRILFVRQGMFVKHSGKQEAVAEPMQALVFNPGDTYRISHPSGQDGEITVIRYAAASVVDTLGGYESAVADRPHIRFASGHAPLSSATVLRVQRLRCDLLQGHASALQVDEEALRILAEVSSFERRLRGWRAPVSRGRAARRQTERIQAVKQMVAANPAAPHTLASLATAVEWSPFSLTRAFRREVGYPLHQYLLRLRVNLALEHLTTRSESLSTIALTLGFASHSHFGTAFRRIVGLSPSEFRNQVGSRGLRHPTGKNVKAAYRSAL